VFMVLSAVLSAGVVSGYVFPLDPIFVAAGFVVLFVEGLFVWRLSTYGGKKALV